MQPQPISDSKIQDGNLPADIADRRIFVYNLNDDEMPGGLKVRVKIRVITGPEAARLDARQAAAIMELLRCAHRQNRPRSR